MDYYRIYPDRQQQYAGELTEMPVWIFLVGNHLHINSYRRFFRKLTAALDIIVYVLDTDPEEEFKTLKGFHSQLPYIRGNIESYYNIEKTSQLYYLGGHQAGATIALNAVYPDNFSSTLHSMTIHAVDLPICGFICLFPTDGCSSHSSHYSDRIKYCADSNTVYVTPHGQVNPYPILAFAGHHSEQDRSGEEIFNAIANSYNHPQNKYCFLSSDIYCSNDIADHASSARNIFSMSRSKSSDINDENEDRDSPPTIRIPVRYHIDEERLEKFHKFIIQKVKSFVFDAEVELDGMDDIHLSRNHLMVLSLP